ncbi:hypothetical protein chiPu_0032106, partial [Chiloscyllium punctatum]|nr:hypothetical protein [Chiloscyllium punctatum]
TKQKVKEKQNLHNFFHQQARWSRLLGGLIPGWFVEMARDQISDLAYDIEKLANSTAHALELVNKELQEIRMMMLQNQLVLDFLLAKGGACSVIGPQRGTYFDDFSKNIWTTQILSINRIKTQGRYLLHHYPIHVDGVLVAGYDRDMGGSYATY